MEVKRTMRSMSVLEKENKSRLDFMVPMDIAGRYQLLTKLKDLVVDIDNVIVKPIHSIPATIKNTTGFFSTDGYWVGSFVAYGKNLMGRRTLLWDDIGVPEIERQPNTVLTKFIKERLSCDNDITIVVAKKLHNKTSLEFYCYLAS